MRMVLRCMKEKVPLWLIWFWLLAVLSAAGLHLPAVALMQEVPKQEQALRTRVEEFYSLLQLGRREQAEAFVSAESKENFASAWNNSSILGFQVESVKFDPDGRAATVLVRVDIFIGFSPKPVSLPRTLRWRLAQDNWYVVVPKPDSNAMKSVFTTPTGKGPRRENLIFQSARYDLGKIEPGEVKTARFPFTTTKDHPVTITEVITGCECLRAKSGKKEYKPGESGELVIEFDSTDRQDFYQQTILVKTDPGDVTHYLHVKGWIVYPAAPRKPAPKQ